MYKKRLDNISAICRSKRLSSEIKIRVETRQESSCLMPFFPYIKL